MTNTAESQNLSVELVSIAEGVEIPNGIDEQLCSDCGHISNGDCESCPACGSTLNQEQEADAIQSTLLFHHVKNTSDTVVQWSYDDHYFIGSDGFQYSHGRNIDTGWDDTHEVLPPHWYLDPSIQPGRKARCVTEVSDFPDGVSVEEIIYDSLNDNYKIEIDRSNLDDPPI